MTEHGNHPGDGRPDSTQPIGLGDGDTARLPAQPGSMAQAPGPWGPTAPGAQQASSAWAPPPGAYPVAAAPTGTPPPRRHTGRLVAAAIALAVVAGAAGGVGGAALTRSQDDQGQQSTVTNPDVAAVAKSVLPGVVTLQVTDRAKTKGGTGSGFVTRGDGYIVTNNHVASAAGDGGVITVAFADGSEVPGKLVGKDASYDLAVVKVDKQDLHVLPFGVSNQVTVGDPVIAVGSPLGLDSTVTAGIISALHRPVSPGGSADQQSYINAIQTDAAINPGNSGGPLIDGRGQVVGVNTAIAKAPGSSSQGESGNIGVGFAIPSDQVKRTVDQLIKTGHAEHPVIGVYLDPDYDEGGAKIAGSGGTPGVNPGGPGDKAGLKEGDVILQVDGQKVTSADMLIVTIRAKQVGESVRLLVRSGGQERTVSVTTAGATG